MNRLFLSILLFLAYSNVLFAQADSSFIKIKTQSENNFLVINNNYNNCIEFNSNDSIKVKSGSLSLKIISKFYADVTTNVSVEKNETEKIGTYTAFLVTDSQRKSRSSYVRCFWDSNVFIISDYDSDIYVEGEKIGVENVRLSLADSSYGTTSKIGNSSSKKTFKANSSFQVIENYVRPEKSTIYLRSLLPGFAQFTKNEKIKGSSFVALSSVLSFSALLFNERVNQENSNYEQLRTEYNTSSNPTRLLEIIEESDRTLDEIDRLKKIRNYSLIGLGVVYTLNIIDGIKPPEIGFRSNKVKINPYVDFDRSMVPNANLKIDF